MSKGIGQIILFVLLMLVSVSFAYYYGSQNNKNGSTPTDNITETPQDAVITETESPSPAEALPTSSVPLGWQTYTNNEYGFEISYPTNYKAMSDSENLYGWPKGIVLFYGGGQSYDLVIEHWNSVAEYEAKYKNQNNVTVKQLGNNYITLLNMNFEPEVDEMIKTFKSL
jgi:hypothetical protein